MKKIYLLVGTRPNFIKVTRFKKIGAERGLEVKLIHTGQHFDDNMANVFFDQFDLRPDYFLNVGGQTPNSQIASILVKLEELFEKEGKPDLFIVPGDVNSTLAGAIAANKMGIKLAHLESGLRSFDKKMPEEHNRIVADNLSDICFITEPSGIKNIDIEKITAEKVFVGNTMIDTLVEFEGEIDKSDVLEKFGIVGEPYILCTFHRPSNVDDMKSLQKLVDLITTLTKYGKVVLPLHPRSKNSLAQHGLLEKLTVLDELVLTPPIGYFEFQRLIKSSKLVITDSGGIQEETTFRQVPCLTVRENTERPVTIDVGTNTLVPFSEGDIEKYIKQIEAGTYKKGQVPELWDGHATERIIDHILTVI